MKPSWETYFMRLCYIVASRATCDRKHVGAVIVSYDHRIVSTGYNGAPAGLAHCDDEGHLLVEGHCVRTLHAESNAVDFAGRFASGCTLFVTVTPCFDCAKRIVNAGITRVVFDEFYASRYGKSADVPDYLRNAGVVVDGLAPEVMASFKEAMKLVNTDPVVVAPGACLAHRYADADRTCIVCGHLER